MARKYIILVGDGMGDYPQEALGGKTPLEAAYTPHMDGIASKGIMGWVQTIPPECEPGSDIANLSILGYDPVRYHRGRAPFEALSLGLSLKDHEVAFRCNLVFLDHLAKGPITMGSYSAGHISTEEARPIITDLDLFFRGGPVSFYPGVGYRHIVLWEGADPAIKTLPPHDLTGREVGGYLQSEGPLAPVVTLMRRSWPFLMDHPTNKARKEKGLLPANSIWLWGQGCRPGMPLFLDRFGLRGGMISAVDLLKGLGLAAGLEYLPVPGITGYLDTNYKGKADKALEALQEKDLVYLHVEAPDEASHEGSLEKKLKAIEDFDREVVGRVLEGLSQMGPFSLLVLTDHFTPLDVMSHTREPAPLGLFRSEDEKNPKKNRGYSERSALEGEAAFPKGDDLIPWFIEKDLRPKA
jgi:2,3-bisphosphoglycerate-independent phosphoglycerate mutase